MLFSVSVLVHCGVCRTFVFSGLNDRTVRVVGGRLSLKACSCMDVYLPVAGEFKTSCSIQVGYEVCVRAYASPLFSLPAHLHIKTHTRTDGRNGRTVFFYFGGR
ncbi:hypothetical protein BDP55DRAFT_655404 [Colletotrichum godetiae]|uniref:Secreted protein n=1 Tax=Colletotrichum godetiae TaxID=1209918 RepID=A0AAJ0F0T7_9PEZI|nr:uncharacterized protein BDP55DRAFT_655404 [Colletotrichum godetiae]KAK1688843.1 hypothetical protein BDP55DRAFT_655404 [Colletotrichum godetiae]